jgi:hypothetical protein
MLEGHRADFGAARHVAHQAHEADHTPDIVLAGGERLDLRADVEVLFLDPDHRDTSPNINNVVMRGLDPRI